MNLERPGLLTTQTPHARLRTSVISLQANHRPRLGRPFRPSVSVDVRDESTRSRCDMQLVVDAARSGSAGRARRPGDPTGRGPIQRDGAGSPARPRTPAPSQLLKSFQLKYLTWSRFLLTAHRVPVYKLPPVRASAASGTGDADSPRQAALYGLFDSQPVPLRVGRLPLEEVG